MPEGSSSAPPVIKPGPRIPSRRRTVVAQPAGARDGAVAGAGGGGSAEPGPSAGGVGVITAYHPSGPRTAAGKAVQAKRDSSSAGDKKNHPDRHHRASGRFDHGFYSVLGDIRRNLFSKF